MRELANNLIALPSFRFLVNLPQPDSQLRVLKAALSDKTGLRPDEMTLTCGGTSNCCFSLLEMRAA